MTSPLSAEYALPKKEARGLWLRVLHRAFPNAFLSPRWDPVFNDGLTWRYLKANLQAWNSARRFDADKVKRIFLIADARGGSHFFESQFHTINGAFCFGEGFPAHSRQALTARAFLLRGMYRVNSLQHKLIGDIRWVFFNINNDAFAPDAPVYKELNNSGNDVAIFLFRNPLRTLASMARTEKSKWQLNEQFVSTRCDLFIEQLRLYASLAERHPERVKGILFEKLVQDIPHVIDECADFIGIEPSKVHEKPNATEFFSSFFRCGSTPIVRNGFLTSPVSEEKITGHGGGFNPIAEVDPKRAIGTPVETLFDKDLLELATHKLGNELYSIFSSDHEHAYSSYSIDDLIAALPQSETA